MEPHSGIILKVNPALPDAYDLTIFPKKIFEIFENYIAKAKDKKAVLSLIGNAFLNDFHQIKLESLSYFMNLLVGEDKLSDLAFEVIAKYLADHFDLKEISLDFKQEAIDKILKYRTKLPVKLVTEILHSYQENQDYFASNIIYIIESNNSDYKEDLTCFAVKINEIIQTQFNLSTKTIKNLVFMTKRLANIHVQLPDNLLSNFIKFTNNEDIYVQRVVKALVSQETKEENESFSQPDQKLTIDYLAKAIYQQDFLSLNHKEKNNIISAFSGLQQTGINIEEFESLLIKCQNESAAENENSTANAKYLVKALKKISNYKIVGTKIDRDGYRIRDVLFNEIPHNWFKSIKRIYDDNNFFVEYTVDELIEVIREMNEDNPEVLKLTEDGQDGTDNYFKKTLARIKQVETKLHYPVKFSYNLAPLEPQNDSIYIYCKNNQIIINLKGEEIEFKDDSDNYTRIYQILNNQQPFHKNDIQYIYKYLSQQNYGEYNCIDSWDKDDFANWRISLNNQVRDDNIASVMAVIKYVIHKTIFNGKYYPRDVQVIASLSLFKSEAGRIAQVPTGEGKSVITDMFVFLRTLNGHSVDVLTSSRELSMRDFDEQKPFYDKIGSNSCHIFTTSNLTA